MTTSPIDFQALFAATVGPHLVLRPDPVILDVNDACVPSTAPGKV
ncbi:hypothetical protein [Streptomyces sp. NPDC001221]